MFLHPATDCQLPHDRFVQLSLGWVLLVSSLSSLVHDKSRARRVLAEVRTRRTGGPASCASPRSRAGAQRLGLAKRRHCGRRMLKQPCFWHECGKVVVLYAAGEPGHDVAQITGLSPSRRHVPRMEYAIAARSPPACDPTNRKLRRPIAGLRCKRSTSPLSAGKRRCRGIASARCDG